MASSRYHNLRRVRASLDSGVDLMFLGLVISLCLFGLLMLYDVSVVKAAQLYGDKFRFVTQQGAYLAIGLTGLFVSSRLDYHRWKALSGPMLIGCLLLLVLVFIPGFGREVLGARRWLTIGPITLQPSYLLCFALIAFLANWLSSERADKWSFKNGYLPFGILMGAILMIVAFLQKDLGSMSLLALTSLMMFFLAGGPLWQVGLTIGGGVAAVGLLVLVEPYRMGRILSFLDKSHDSLNASYHINQALIALGSGGLLGVGIGQSRQKYSYLPEVQSDSIFAIIGEELGFFGAAIILVAFLFILWRGMKIAIQAPDTFGRLLVGGIMSLLGVQIFVNLFAIAGVIPLTGIPLPFFSSGGTSLIVLLLAMGIVLNVSRQTERPAR